MRTEARISGPGGSTRQVALYFAGGEQMHDFRTIQDHDAPHTTSDLLFKGAVQDYSRSVYTGLIKIRKHARGTSAFQTNRNLTLSEGAWAESVPNLEIETNDVKCSHASTVGPIDPEQRFYLESRGIPTQIAERLIVLGFFDEVLDQLPVGPLAAELRAGVSAKLDLERTLTGVAVMATERDVRPRRARPRAGHGSPRRGRRRRRRPRAHRRRRVYAIGDVCSHANVSLSEGEVWCDERELECPKHGSTFSLDTGEPVTLPATQPVPVFTAESSTASDRDGHVAEERGAAMTTLEIRGLRAAVGGKEILRGIDLTVSSGEVQRRDGSQRRRQEHALGRRHGPARVTRCSPAASRSTASTCWRCRRGSGPRPACTS